MLLSYRFLEKRENLERSASMISRNINFLEQLQCIQLWSVPGRKVDPHDPVQYFKFLLVWL